MLNSDHLSFVSEARNARVTFVEKLQIKKISFEKQKDGHLIQTHLDIAYNDYVVNNTWYSINEGSLEIPFKHTIN